MMWIQYFSFFLLRSCTVFFNTIIFHQFFSPNSFRKSSPVLFGLAVSSQKTFLLFLKLPYFVFLLQYHFFKLLSVHLFGLKFFFYLCALRLSNIFIFEILIVGNIVLMSNFAFILFQFGFLSLSNRWILLFDVSAY